MPKHQASHRKERHGEAKEVKLDFDSQAKNIKSVIICVICGKINHLSVVFLSLLSEGYFKHPQGFTQSLFRLKQLILIIHEITKSKDDFLIITDVVKP